MTIDLQEKTKKAKLVRFDWAFKYLLRNKANFDILEGFLSELLKTTITIETILESESNKNHPADKFNRVDLLVKTSDNTHIIVEMQCSSQWDYLNRILYGTSKVVCEQLHSGDAYIKICKVISISIVFFDVGVGKDYLYKGTTVFKGLHYHDTLNLNPHEQKVYQAAHTSLKQQTPEDVFPEYYIIKVAQFHEKVASKLDEWIYFFKHSEIKQEFSAQGLRNAAKKLDTLSLSEEERYQYKKYQESLHDEASFNNMIDVTHNEGHAKGHTEGRAKGHAEGRAKGHAEGRAESQVEIAKSLKQDGLSDQKIAMHTGLSLEEIQKL